MVSHGTKMVSHGTALSFTSQTSTDINSHQQPSTALNSHQQPLLEGCADSLHDPKGIIRLSPNHDVQRGLLWSPLGVGGSLGTVPCNGMALKYRQHSNSSERESY